VKNIKNVTRGTTAGLLATLATAVAAQETSGGGTILNLGVSQRLGYSDNHSFTATPASAFTSVTGLSFALTSATKTEMFSVNTAGGVTYDSADNAFTVSDPNLSLAYMQDSKNATFVSTLGYRETDVSSAVDVNIGSSSFVILDEGTRIDLGGRVSLEFGKTDPISGNVTLTHNKTTYRGTTSADLVDQDTTGLAATLNFRVDDRITTSVSGNLSRRVTAAGLDTTNVGIGAGVSLAYSKRLALSASMRYNLINQTNGGAEASSDGIGFSLGADYEMPDGAITASLTSSVDEFGRTYNGNIGRSMELKAGQLSYSLGLSARGNGALRPLYAISYSQELPRDAEASVQLTQSFDTNDSGRDAINTSLSANYSMPLSAVSGIGASLQYRSTMITNFDNEDVSRLDVGINYTHALAEDWGLVTGYSHAIATTDTAADIRSNTVFVGLQKDFSWRP